MMLLPPPELRLDPYPFFAAMRRQHPVVRDAESGVWGLFRYEDVRFALKDFTTFSSDFHHLRQPPPSAAFLRPSLLRLDPPRHRQLRGIVSLAFTPATVARLEPKIRTITHDLLDRVSPSGRMDLIDDLAYPLPVAVIADLLGVPVSDRELFRRWADALLGPATLLFEEDAGGNRERTMADMDAYFGEIIARRRASPGDDLISALVAAEIEGQHLSEAEILSFCSLLLLAGHVTTVNLIGNAVWSLLDHPDQLARLQADPSLAAATVEEVLRYRSPVQAVTRVTLRDVEVAGQTIPAGERIVTWIGSANRDVTVFPDPDRFDITRHATHHLAFGSGIHVCLGAPLARLEGRVVLGALLERLQELNLADQGPLEPLNSLVLQGVRHLPLRFAPHRPQRLSQAA